MIDVINFKLCLINFVYIFLRHPVENLYLRYFFCFSLTTADAYIIQIQRYDLTPTTPATQQGAQAKGVTQAAPGQKTQATGKHGSNPGTPATGSPVTKTGVQQSNSPSLKVNVNAASALAKAQLQASPARVTPSPGSAPVTPTKLLSQAQVNLVTQKKPGETTPVTPGKMVTQVPLQLTTVGGQQIALAALNQGLKVSGSPTPASPIRQVQMLTQPSGVKSPLIRQTSPAASKAGINQPILTIPRAATPTAAGQAAAKVTASQLVTTAKTQGTTPTTAAPTQYALVRAQIPGTGGGPPQTVTFIRAIAPGGQSSPGGATVTVTPQQMAALLRGQTTALKGSPQVQIRTTTPATQGSTTAGLATIRQPNPASVAHTAAAGAAGNAKPVAGQASTPSPPVTANQNKPVFTIQLGAQGGGQPVVKLVTNTQPGQAAKPLSVTAPAVGIGQAPKLVVSKPMALVSTGVAPVTNVNISGITTMTSVTKTQVASGVVAQVASNLSATVAQVTSSASITTPHVSSVASVTTQNALSVSVSAPSDLSVAQTPSLSAPKKEDTKSIDVNPVRHDVQQMQGMQDKKEPKDEKLNEQKEEAEGNQKVEPAQIKEDKVDTFHESVSLVHSSAPVTSQTSTSSAETIDTKPQSVPAHTPPVPVNAVGTLLDTKSVGSVSNAQTSIPAQVPVSAPKSSALQSQTITSTSTSLSATSSQGVSTTASAMATMTSTVQNGINATSQVTKSATAAATSQSVVTSTTQKIQIALPQVTSLPTVLTPQVPGLVQPNRTVQGQGESTTTVSASSIRPSTTVTPSNPTTIHGVQIPPEALADANPLSTLAALASSSPAAKPLPNSASHLLQKGGDFKVPTPAVNGNTRLLGGASPSPGSVPDAPVAAIAKGRVSVTHFTSL